MNGCVAGRLDATPDAVREPRTRIVEQRERPFIHAVEGGLKGEGPTMDRYLTGKGRSSRL
jgi:hypothetical protein